MVWIVLTISGVLEAVWATALEASENFKYRRPTVLFVVAFTVSLAMLGYALTELPTGTAYAIWVGIGAALVVFVGVIRGDERLSLARFGLLVTLIGSVIGLQVMS